MRNGTGSATRLILPWSTIGKVLIAITAVWLWMQLWELVLLLVVGILIAVALDPLVRAAERHGTPRSLAAVAAVLTLVLIVLAFLVGTWSSLSAQAHLVADRMVAFEQAMLARVPPSVYRALGSRASAIDVASYLGSAALVLLQSSLHAVVVVLIALILTFYLLIEGANTTAWLLAFVSPAQRPRVRAMMIEIREVMVGYVAGNLVTSLFAAAVVFVALSALHVPAALLLALMAGVCDFMPIVGFAVSALPALLLATTVSQRTVVLVLALYVAYHAIENYVIAPKVYGDRLRLSSLTVVLAFATGAQLGGVIGALVALPIAAAYPVIERRWLREPLGDRVVQEHRALEARSEPG